MRKQPTTAIKRRRLAPATGRGLGVAALIFIGTVSALVVWALRQPGSPPNHPAGKPAAVSASGTTVASNLVVAPAPPGATMEINQAVMVTVELDFGGPVPGIAEALTQIERRHQSDDGTGRVFAVLDAYGEPTADGKKLHVSMHVSTEKPGLGTLVFRRTGEVLWQSRVVRGTNATSFTGKNLTILVDNGKGQAQMVDGSGNPLSILDAKLRDTQRPLREFWPDGAEREVTFIYSACGCPVKAMVRRTGDRTMRTQELPVMFPDDPGVLMVIARLMGW